MKLVILKQNLKDSLGIVERGVKDDANLPILKNVLLKADTQLKLVTTNLELGITNTTPAKILESGSITIPFGPLANIIGTTDSERIQLNVDKNILTIKTDNYEATIQGISEENFPIIPKVENVKELFSIQASVFKESINQIISAAHISDLKPELSGILFDFQIGILKLVATDSYRLAEKTINSSQFTTTIKKGVKAIIPLTTIYEALKAFSDTETIEIYLDPHQILFQSKNTSIISRLIDGEYPDYEPIIPKEVTCEILLEREKLLTAIKLASNFTSKTSDIRIRSEKGQKTINVYSANQALGENTYVIPVKKVKGDGFDNISFNWRYILDGVRSINTKQLRIGITDDTKPAVMKPNEDDSLLYIVMPTKSV